MRECRQKEQPCLWGESPSFEAENQTHTHTHNNQENLQYICGNSLIRYSLGYLPTRFKTFSKSLKLRSPVNSGMPLPNSSLIPSAWIPTLERDQDYYY